MEDCFLIIIAIAGTIFTWMPAFFWNKASYDLPVSLAGQLLVSQNIFSLIYNYFYTRSFPTMAKTSGIILVIGGIFLSIRRVHSYAKNKLEEPSE